ncbi:MAG: DUF4105 domain-containing protein [Tannerella sp.]|jgi:hypothetical protein|nr:DUF4105 domain-containing protein [Tannerella sp.]
MMEVSETVRFRWRKFLPFVLLLCCSLAVGAQEVLSEKSRVSLLTCSPDDKAAYTLYGHSAIRVCDTTGLDYVFNYGVFDFSKPNFIYRFTKGETDYVLAVSKFDEFMMDYAMRGSEVFEQELNLTTREKNRIMQALVVNALPVNRVYRYSFFYDNCSTRPVSVIGRQLDGYIQYEPYNCSRTYRDIINKCTRDYPWLTFGCDLVLGLPADEVMTLKESFFLPDNVKQTFANAQIVHYGDSVPKPLVAKSTVVLEAVPDDEPAGLNFTPLAAAIILFALAVAVSIVGWRQRKSCRWFDVLLFTLAGIAGCVLWFLCFISVHRGIFPNINVMWLHPFHLIGAVFFAVKKLNKAAVYYHFINFAAIFAMIVVWFFLRQHLNLAFIPLIASLLLRSIMGLTRK